MPFGATVVGDVFQRRLDQCFGHLKNVIVITDDIMVVGKQPNHRDHDTATFASTMTSCNINKQKLTSLVKCIQQMEENHHRVK